MIERFVGPDSDSDLPYAHDISTLVSEWSIPDEFTRSAIVGFGHAENRRATMGVEDDTSVQNRALEYVIETKEVDPLSFAATMVALRQQHKLLEGSTDKDLRYFLEAAAELSVGSIQTAVNLGAIGKRYSHKDPIHLRRVVGELHPDAYDKDPQGIMDRMRKFQKNLSTRKI